jgi:hypothetical protein
MGAIYGQAFLTICALSSPNAGVGLLRFSEVAPGELPLDLAMSTEKCAYVSSPPDLTKILHLLPYERRAWTFQERLLSRRCLFFIATHLYLHCQEDGIYANNSFGKGDGAHIIPSHKAGARFPN